MLQTTVARAASRFEERVRAHLSIMRLDHSVKQVFILPGIVLAIAFGDVPVSAALLENIVLGMLAITAIASSNYVLNEVLDAPFDRLHPTKCARSAACGAIHLPSAYAQWMCLAAVGFLLAHAVSGKLFLSAAALWGMGCAYNVAPFRTKDIPYLDVLSESVNNPLRFCAGWYMVPTTVTPPVSVLIAYWMLGAYFMALKRFSEYRQIGPARAEFYRKSFRYYTQKSILNSVVFYAAAAMLFFGAFIMRYRLELVLTFPLIAFLMAVYFSMSFEPDSAVQNPEKLFRERRLMLPLAICVLLLVALLFLDLPFLTEMFPRSMTAGQ